MPWLHSLRISNTDNLESLEKILCYIDATVILHNILNEFGNADETDDSLWVIDEEHLSDIGNVNHIAKRDCLDVSLPPGSLGERQEQLKNYINET